MKSKSLLDDITPEHGAYVRAYMIAIAATYEAMLNRYKVAYSLPMTKAEKPK